MTPRDLLLAIDAGGSVVKATVFRAGGGESATVSRAVPLTRPQPGHNERDAELLGAVVVDVQAAGEPELIRLLRTLHWGTAWLRARAPLPFFGDESYHHAADAAAGRFDSPEIIQRIAQFQENGPEKRSHATAMT